MATKSIAAVKTKTRKDYVSSFATAVTRLASNSSDLLSVVPQILVSDFARRRTAFAAPQQVGQGDACPAPNSFDLMIHVAEERYPMKLIRRLLFFDGGSPVVLLYDSPVTQN